MATTLDDPCGAIRERCFSYPVFPLGAFRDGAAVGMTWLSESGGTPVIAAPLPFASEGGIAPKVLEEAHVQQKGKSTPIHADTGSCPEVALPLGPASMVGNQPESGVAAEQ